MLNKRENLYLPIVIYMGVMLIAGIDIQNIINLKRCCQNKFDMNDLWNAKMIPRIRIDYNMVVGTQVFHYYIKLKNVEQI